MVMEFKVNGVEVLHGLHDTKILLTLPGLGAADADRLSAADRPWRCRMAEWREKRSLDANAYFWVLIDKLSEATGIGKEEMYRQYIRSLGGAADVVCVQEKAADALIAGWQRNGLGWQAEKTPSKLPGCVNVILYYGSSTFDTAQMSRLIDMVVQDCQAVGIETKTPAEIEKLVSLWDQ